MFRSTKALVALALVLVTIFSTVVCALADTNSELLDLINKERKAAGLKQVALNSDLNRVAELRAAEIVESWSHTRPNGEEWKTAFADAGVSSSYRGENLAKGQYSAEMVVEDWMSSSGHKANILNKKFTKMGVASVVIDGVTYWVQVFANDVKTTKKTTTKGSTSSSAKTTGTTAANTATKTASAPTDTGSSQQNSKPNYNQTGSLDKLARTIDLDAAMKAPAVKPTLGKNPGL